MARFIVMCVVMLLAGCAHSGRTQAPVSKHEIQVRLDLAESYLTGGKPRLALQELLHIESDARGVPRFGFDMAMAYLAVNEPVLAQESMARAVALDPEYGEAWNNLGRIRETLGNPEEARTAYERALSVLTYRTPELAACNLAKLFRKQGRTEDAFKYAELAVDKNWRYGPAYLLLAELALGRNDAQTAQTWLDRGTAADMDDPDLLLAWGENLVRLDRGAEAKDSFRRIVKEHPGSDQAGTALEYLHMLR